MSDIKLIFWIKFDLDAKPEKIYAQNYVELQRIIAREVERRGQIYEWIIRDYK